VRHVRLRFYLASAMSCFLWCGEDTFHVNEEDNPHQYTLYLCAHNCLLIIIFCRPAQDRIGYADYILDSYYEEVSGMDG